MVSCLERGAELHMAQLIPLPLTVSCFSEIQIGFTWYRLTRVVPEKGPLNGCVCVCEITHVHCCCVFQTNGINGLHTVLSRTRTMNMRPLHEIFTILGLANNNNLCCYYTTSLINFFNFLQYITCTLHGFTTINRKNP